MLWAAPEAPIGNSLISLSVIQAKQIKCSHLREGILLNSAHKMMLNSGVWQILILPPGRERVKGNEAALKQCVKGGKWEFRLYVHSSRLASGFHREQILNQLLS